jgi:hypothetical protein
VRVVVLNLTVNRTPVEDKMRIFTGECAHFNFNKGAKLTCAHSPLNLRILSVYTRFVIQNAYKKFLSNH